VGFEGFFISAPVQRRKDLQAPRWSLNQNPVAANRSGQLKDQHMKKTCWMLASASLFVTLTSFGQFADTVLSYNPGTGFATGFTNATAALGAPSSGSSITPFAPAFQKSQIVSIGAGGSLTLHLSAPIVHASSNPFGIDFMVFGNSGFVVTNGNFSGGGITDGSLFGNNTGSTRVEVSADGANWFTLNPSLAPTVDGLFPTDGTGNPLIPADPSLTGFAGLGLSGIRSLYAGSAGGTGFDLSWAQDANGNNVSLPEADYVRVDVLSGKSEIDAVSVVPEPGICSLVLMGLWFCVLAKKGLVTSPVFFFCTEADRRASDLEHALG
jgi:hypothetical protein